MTADAFLRALARNEPPPVLLFAGPDAYRRQIARRLLLEKCLPPEDRHQGFDRHDLDETSLADVLDDARAMSLFARRRLIWVASAESALPRARAAAGDAVEDAAPHSGAPALLAAYCQNPTPGVTLVFDARRWDFDGEDKPKMERLLKFYAPIPDKIEFRRFSPHQACELARTLAAERSLPLGSKEAELLVAATAADALRIAAEVEKLALFSAAGARPIDAAAIAALVPDAQESTVFELVDALARRDRIRALHILGLLLRAGQYLPLALMFLQGLFRLALAASENNLRSAQDVQNYFQRLGLPMWRARAEQVWLASSRFPKDRLSAAITAIFDADNSLKSSRPDDRLVLENFILRLTA